MPSFHILIASIGRPSLQIMLNSLLPQLRACDHVTIVFDDVEPPQLNTERAECQIHIHRQTPNLGAWGHGIRNTYAKRLEPTDFVMHADDDDIYTKGAFDQLRKLCRNPMLLYIAKMDKRGIIFPLATYIKEGEIGTPCGIIPYQLNKLGNWLPRIGGDGKFYEGIARRAKGVRFLDAVIYKVEINL